MSALRERLRSLGEGTGGIVRQKMYRKTLFNTKQGARIREIIPSQPTSIVIPVKLQKVLWMHDLQRLPSMLRENRMTRAPIF